jgi:hypothetical protein
VVLRADIPHRRLRPTDQDQKQALGDPRLGQVFFRKLMLALPCRTVDHGNVVRLDITANATAEPAGVMRLRRSKQASDRSQPALLLSPLTASHRVPPLLSCHRDSDELEFGGGDSTAPDHLVVCAQNWNDHD